MTKAKKRQTANEMIPALRKMFGEGVEFQCTTRFETNRARVGLCMLLPGEADSPIVYMEDMPENATLEERVRYAACRFQKIRRDMAQGDYAGIPQMPELSREYVLDNVVLQALSLAKNRSMPESVAHYRELDMIGVFRIPVGPYRRGSLNSFLVPGDIQEAHRISGQEMKEAAWRNTVRKFGLELIKVSAMKKQFLRGQDWTVGPFERAKMDKPGNCLLTNRIRMNGAAAILIPQVREAIAEKAGEDYYVLPSSIHEVLITKSSDTDPGMIEDMKKKLHKGNRTPAIVSKQDVLTDSIYFYSRKDHTLRIVQAQRREEPRPAGGPGSRMCEMGRKERFRPRPAPGGAGNSGRTAALQWESTGSRTGF